MALLAVYFTGICMSVAVSCGVGIVCGCFGALLTATTGSPSGAFNLPLFPVFYGVGLLVAIGFALIALGRAAMRQAYSRGFSEPKELPLAFNVRPRKIVRGG
jgi:hypothetical protein